MHYTAVTKQVISFEFPFLACHCVHKAIQISIHSILRIVTWKFYRPSRIHYRLLGYYNLSYLANLPPITVRRIDVDKKKVYIHMHIYAPPAESHFTRRTTASQTRFPFAISRDEANKNLIHICLRIWDGCDSHNRRRDVEVGRCRPEDGGDPRRVVNARVQGVCAPPGSIAAHHPARCACDGDIIGFASTSVYFAYIHALVLRPPPRHPLREHPCNGCVGVKCGTVQCDKEARILCRSPNAVAVVDDDRRGNCDVPHEQSSEGRAVLSGEESRLRGWRVRHLRIEGRARDGRFGGKAV